MKINKAKIITLHLIFWLLNYWYVTSGNLSWNWFSKKNNLLAIAYSYGIIINAFLFYIQVFLLVPKFYLQNKKLKYWLFSISILIIATFTEAYLDVELGKKYNVYKEISLIAVGILWFYHNLMFHILYSIGGFLYRFQHEYIKAEKAKQQLLTETHKTELKYLKAQLNPHFLFNGINNVYHLIGKNNNKAKDTLIQFSDLLRYQLYESNVSYISLEEELEYILKYIKLEELRKGNDITLQYDINFKNKTLKIAPLLLIPFVENTFKHCSNFNESEKNIISIQITENEEILVLKTSNTFDDIQNNNTNGIGLNNVKRRLELLYKNKYELEINKSKNTFSTYLKIQLN